MKLIAVLLFVFNVQLCALPAWAADICKATVMHDVPAREAPESVMKKGEEQTAVTEYLVDKLTGDTFLCSHGGYCYPMFVDIVGTKVRALQLENCEVDKTSASQDAKEVSYDLLPIRAIIPRQDIKHDDLDNRFLALGLCSACADNVATLYIEKPQSQCAITARQALEGDPDAVTSLRTGKIDCNAYVK